MSEQIKHHRNGIEAEPVFFFVSGPPKSGTTWLMRLIDAHPEAVCSGEGHFFDRVRPLFMKAFQEYQKLLELDAKLVFSGKPVYEPLRVSELDHLMRVFVTERLRARNPNGMARALGDKTPRNYHDLSALFAAFPKARLIFLMRDPRDVAVSLFGHMRRRINLGLSKEADFNRQKILEVSVQHCRACQTALSKVEAQRPGVAISLNYEALLNDTFEEYRKICAHLGLSEQPDVLTKAIEACDFRRLSGGRAPGQRDDNSFFTSGKSGSWREILTPEEAAFFERTAPELLT